ncbi:hypothetical protein VCHENC02_0348B, partial [Vibrio harveyi]
KARKFIPHD